MPTLIITREGPEEGWVAEVENSGGVAYIFQSKDGDALPYVERFAELMNDGPAELQSNIIDLFDTTETDPEVIMRALFWTTDEMVLLDDTVFTLAAGEVIMDNLEWCGLELMIALGIASRAKNTAPERTRR